MLCTTGKLQYLGILPNSRSFFAEISTCMFLKVVSSMVLQWTICDFVVCHDSSHAAMAMRLVLIYKYVSEIR